jgi:uncharacterized protein (DUF1800 family)
MCAFLPGLPNFSLILAGLMVMNLPLYADYSTLFTVGVLGDGYATELGDPVYNSAPPPGSPTLRDNDYYVASEPWSNCARALAENGPRNRLHFTLNAAQVSGTSMFRFSFATLWATWAPSDSYGAHIITVKMNGQTLGVRTLQHPQTITMTVNAATAQPVVGDNVIELILTTPLVGSWISFDYYRLEHNPTGLTDADGDGLPQHWEQEHSLNDSDPSDAAKDGDSDGSNNTAEFTRQTDPQAYDTDLDGIKDSLETTTNPLLADTDGDSLADGAELASLPPTNPLVADTDGDGATDAWEQRTGYDASQALSTPPGTQYGFGMHFVSEGSPLALLRPTEIAGFVPQMQWNNTRLVPYWTAWNGSTLDIGSPVADTMVNSAGSPSGATFNCFGNFYWNGNIGPGNQKLLNGFLGVYGNTPASITLQNIPYANYDVLVYVGSFYMAPQGFVRLNNNSSTDKHFLADSLMPVSEFTELAGSTSQRPWRGNLVRYRKLTGSTCSIEVHRTANWEVGLHAIQVVDNTLDSDGDGLPNWWEFTYKLKPSVSGDAAQDFDADGLSNLGEYQRQTHPRMADTDGDGASDLVETGTGTWVSATNAGSNPLLSDTDGDSLTDGQEIHMNPHPLNPNLADSDGDGRTDSQEVAQSTDGNNANPANVNMPVVTVSPRSFSWELDNLQVHWDHTKGHTADNPWNEDFLFYTSVYATQSAGDEPIRAGLRLRGGRVTYYFYTDNGTTFSYPYQPDSDFWHSDWNDPPVNLRAALGFSGVGDHDFSDRLRFRVTGSCPSNAAGQWNCTFEIFNKDTNQVVSTQSFTNCTAAPILHNGSITWRDNSDPPQANRLQFWKHAGVQLYFQSTPLENTPGFMAWKDTDEDGMLDTWEDAHGFNKNSALDAVLDADNDGATNVKEFLANTQPHDADSDNDLVKDGAELAAGSNPLLATSKPDLVHGLPSGVLGEDLNGNGLKDSWESYNGTFALLGQMDNDGDGSTNAQENLAGTHPLDPRSRLWSSTSRQGNDLTLAWPRLLYKRHRIWQSQDLGTWSELTMNPGVFDQEFRQTFTNVLSGAPKFYRTSVHELDTDSDGVTDWTEEMVLGSSSTDANSRMSAQPLDANQDGVPESTVSGDYAALLQNFQGASGAVSGGFPVGSTPGNSTGNGLSKAQAARFLTQASFGPTMEDIDQVQQLGYSGWIIQQLSLPPTLHSAYIDRISADSFGPQTDRSYSSDSNGFIFGNNLMSAFARAAVQGEDQLRQRMAFALSQILVASRRDANLEVNTPGMANYYDIFVENGLGNYRDVLLKVALHPCMGRYLSHIGNQKANPAINQYPDENFAREVMQLFTIGLWQLNMDGTRKLNASGQPIPTYSNTEITQMARVFTGFWYGGHEWGSGGWMVRDFLSPMRVEAGKHDFGQKTLLNGHIQPARPPTDEAALQDVTEALLHLFNHPNTAPFISKQLIQFLVTDNPSPAYVERVAAKFADNGSGVRGDLAAVARTILLDPEAREPRHTLQNPTAGRLKEPVIRTMALARAFGMKKLPGFLWWDWGDFYAASRQEPSYSPSVFNFYRPDYRAAGLLTQNNLAGPVFQITDSYSTIALPNKFWDIITNGFRMEGIYHCPLDFSQEVPLAATPELLVDKLNLIFCAGQLSAETRSIILNALNQIPAEQTESRCRVAAYLMLVSPEGAVMR